MTPLVALAFAHVALAADPVADFALRDGDGNVVKLSDHRGQVVLVDFWATWCGPCKDELPHLQKMHSELADQGFVVLAVTTDDARTKGQVKPYLKRAGITLPVLYDTDSAVLAAHNPAKTLPFSVLVGRDFTVASVHSGFSPGDEVALRAKVVGLLAATPPAPPAPPAVE